MAKQLLLNYSVLDGSYQNGSVKYVAGEQDASSVTPAVGTVDNPRESGVPLKPTDPDPKMFSYAYKGRVRVLVAKVVSPVSGVEPQTTWSLYESTPDGFWSPLAKDIVLYTGPYTQVSNPYGVAHLGDWLYIVNYDSQKISILGVNELNGLADGTFHKLEQPHLDLGPGTTADLDPNAKGQAVITLTNTTANPTVSYLYALFINMDASFQHSKGYLVRMTIDPTTGTLTYDAQCQTALNPQEIIPLTDSNEKVTLVIPSVGGSQQAGGSNGMASMIQGVDPFAAVTAFSASPLITGAASGTYDIFNIAAPDRADDKGVVYILTHDYGTNYVGTDWRLYSTTVEDLLYPSASTLPANFGSPDSGTNAPGYFWNILYENGPGANGVNDRLWFFQGTPLRVSPATSPITAYATNIVFPVGTGPGDIGGQNVDWADLAIETVRQALANKSLKHSVRAAQPPAVAEEEDK